MTSSILISSLRLHFICSRALSVTSCRHAFLRRAEGGRGRRAAPPKGGEERQPHSQGGMTSVVTFSMYQREVRESAQMRLLVGFRDGSWFPKPILFVTPGLPNKPKKSGHRTLDKGRPMVGLQHMYEIATPPGQCRSADFGRWHDALYVRLENHRSRIKLSSVLGSRPSSWNTGGGKPVTPQSPPLQENTLHDEHV